MSLWQYIFSENTVLWIKSNNVKGACIEKLSIKNSCLDLKKGMANTIIFRQNMQGFRTSLKTKISPLYTYNKNNTKSKTNTTSPHYMDRSSPTNPYKDNKQKLSNKHALQVRRSTSMQCISKSCIITRDPFIYNIIYNTKKKTKKQKQNQHTQKGDKRQNWDTRSNGDTPTLIKYLQ